MKAVLISGLILFALIFTAHSLPAAAAAPSACLSGPINTNTTWSITDSPVEICVSGLTVAQGATLTVDPGVTVKFDNGVASSIYVQGVLSAIGTPTQPITFTGMLASPG